MSGKPLQVESSFVLLTVVDKALELVLPRVRMRIPLPMFQVRCIMLVPSRVEPFLCQRASESVAVLVWSCRPSYLPVRSQRAPFRSSGLVGLPVAKA